MKNNSKNNTILAWLTFGDGYHNNHHRYPRSAFHGMLKHEIDLNGLIIMGLKKARPRPQHHLRRWLPRR